MTLNKTKMEKITFRSNKRALRNRNANKSTVLLRSNHVFIVG